MSLTHRTQQVELNCLASAEKTGKELEGFIFPTLDLSLATAERRVALMVFCTARSNSPSKQRA